MDLVETPVELKKMLQAKAPDMPMRADDILFVPSSVGKVVVARAAEAADPRQQLSLRSIDDPAGSGRDRAPLIFPDQGTQHFEILHRGLAARKMM